jgi:predicted O-methyltransferase YrrM
MGKNRGRLLLVVAKYLNQDRMKKYNFTKTKPQIICPTCCAGHAPFLFYLTEIIKPRKVVSLGVWYGFSHFVFCQACSMFESRAECHAVDTWEGDKNMGRFNSSIFEFFSNQMDKFFPLQKPNIHKKMFSEALSQFADGSIDILFIDGAHAYEDVRDDFNEWLPKLSDRGVVLLHDTVVSGENFGVSKFFAEMAFNYPSFNFEHNHGLGILLAGVNRNKSLMEICNSTQEEFANLHEFFEEAGRPLELEVECLNLRKQLSTAMHQNELMKNSLSWRITAPLRYF